MARIFEIEDCIPTDAPLGNFIPSTRVKIQFEPASNWRRYHVLSVYPDKRSWKTSFYTLREAIEHCDAECARIRELWNSRAA